MVKEEWRGIEGKQRGEKGGQGGRGREGHKDQLVFYLKLCFTQAKNYGYHYSELIHVNWLQNATNLKLMNP